MKYTIKWVRRDIENWIENRLHLLAVMGLVLAAWTGQPVGSVVGWEACPPQVIALSKMSRQHKHWEHVGLQLDVGWSHLRHTWMRALARSELLLGVWLLGSQRLSSWILLLPWLEWLSEGLSVAWPWLGRQPEMRLLWWALRWVRWGGMLVLSGDAVAYRVERLPWLKWKHATSRFGDAVLCGLGSMSQPQVTMTVEEDGYRIDLRGEFHLKVKGINPFKKRMAIIFLRELEGPTPRQGSRETRSERRPLVSQQKLAAWFGVPQPNISRWEKYWLEEDWANLLSLKSAEVLTVELRDQIIDVFAHFPWHGVEWVYKYLHEQGIEVTYTQVKQASRDSGLAKLKESMQEFFVLNPESIHPRDETLVKELMGQVQSLVDKLSQGDSITPQQELEIAHLKTVTTELGLTPPPSSAIPWGQKIKWILFASEAPQEEDVVRCIYCGCPSDRRKGLKPRTKRYKDERGKEQTVEVYRYYCDNPDCPYGSFTHFPLGLLPYSPYPLDMRLKVVQMYALGRSSYRRTALAFGIPSGRAYQWVSTLGEELLPVAALFGVVRSSGVIGVDEKWVKVPKNNKPGGKNKKWMYVYMAVDVYTYDLLHIEIYAYNTAASTQTFLLALKAKGYYPKVIVSDLRKEYGPSIEKIFSVARHHECIFHGMQWFHIQLKEIYGNNYAKTHPEAVKLKRKIKAALQVKTKRTAQKRYNAIMGLQESYVAQEPKAAAIFDSLERHWPTLVNGIESTIIPKTNNTVELVIGRFDQHYQNFCGFDSLESARLFLAVFEKVYRFTPFTQDAQERIRGKCPLELAGYDISKLPMTQICRGWAFPWPLSTQEVIPNA